jgi:hypothetical protein
MTNTEYFVIQRISQRPPCKGNSVDRDLRRALPDELRSIGPKSNHFGTGIANATPVSEEGAIRPRGAPPLRKRQDFLRLRRDKPESCINLLEVRALEYALRNREFESNLMMAPFDGSRPGYRRSHSVTCQPLGINAVHPRFGFALRPRMADAPGELCYQPYQECLLSSFFWLSHFVCASSEVQRRATVRPG